MIKRFVQITVIGLALIALLAFAVACPKTEVAPRKGTVVTKPAPKTPEKLPEGVAPTEGEEAAQGVTEEGAAEEEVVDGSAIEETNETGAEEAGETDQSAVNEGETAEGGEDTESESTS